MLEELAAATAVGFMDWKDYYGGFDGIVYADPKTCGYRGDDEKGAEGYYVVQDTCLVGHHDIVSIYGRFDDNFSVRAIQYEDEEGGWYLSIKPCGPGFGDLEIAVEDGEWHFCV